jgi:hypothetical protein
MILRDLPDPSTLLAFQAEQEMVVAEMRISCMQGLLQCLPCKRVPQAMAAINNAYIDPKHLQYVGHSERKTKDPMGIGSHQR